MLKEHKGLPPHYQGAYEIWAEKNGKQAPTFSINQVARDKHRIIVDEDEGVIIHKPTGARIPFIMRNGVYFINMRVPKALARPADTHVRRHGMA